MKIAYKNKQININLFFGILWLINGIVQVIFDENPNWLDYSWFVFSTIYLVIFFYQKVEKYITIEDDIIKQNWPFGKKINIKDIKQIKIFAGDFIIKTNQLDFVIHKSLIDKNSFIDLKRELEKLNVEWV